MLKFLYMSVMHRTNVTGFGVFITHFFPMSDFGVKKTSLSSIDSKTGTCFFPDVDPIDSYPIATILITRVNALVRDILGVRSVVSTLFKDCINHDPDCLLQA